MMNVLKTQYWSRSDAFLLPLTGLSKSEDCKIDSHLFWGDYSIHNYNLILTISGEDYDKMTYCCKRMIFPTLDKKGYLLENYDVGDKSVFILDMSEWAHDIEFFLQGKYSRLSDAAKREIERYHTFNFNKIPLHIYYVLHPNTPMSGLEGMTPIEYICRPDTYGLNLEDVKKIGEIGTLYEQMNETLITDVESLYKSV